MSVVREHVVKRFTRSSGWRKIRNAHLVLFPRCAICGTKKSLEVHHIKPFKDHPELELDPSNLETLCGKRCHFVFGHLFNWKAINSRLEETIKHMKSVIFTSRVK